MVEIRFHGRGGQGTVVASKILATAMVREGKYVQAFPEYGVERRGQPVSAFIRIDDKRVNLRCKIYEPDHVVVLDPTLLEAVDVTAGLKDGGWLIINSSENPKNLPFAKKYRLGIIDATQVAVKHGLGSKTAPIVNTAILGAFAKLTGLVKIESIAQAAYELAPVKKEENVKAVKEASKLVHTGAGRTK